MTPCLAESRDEVSPDFFFFLEESGRKILAGLVGQRKMEREELLYKVGEHGDDVFFLVQGRLSVLKSTGFHNKMQVVAILEPGAVFGEAAVFSGHVHGTSVRAVEPSLLYCLSRSMIEELARQDCGLYAALLRRLLQVTSLRLEKASSRLAHVL